jgi:hypothetical protein
MHSTRALLLIASLPLALGCAAPGVQYRGRTAPSVAGPAELREVELLPEGYDRIGHVSARCRLVEGKRPPRGARLVDVDCGESRLMAGVRETAARSGGELLVGRRCSSRIAARDEVSVTLDVSCQADVARPSDDSLGRRPLVSAVLAEADAPRASEAWNIRVDFSPSRGAPIRAARRAEDVREVADMPVSHVRLGDVVTHCKRECSEQGARLGLLAAAGRFGASDVVELRCVAKGHGWLCSGTAASYEADPSIDQRAR